MCIRDSCHAIVEALRAGLRRVRLPECAVSLIEDTSHASANELMTADGLVDALNGNAAKPKAGDL